MRNGEDWALPLPLLAVFMEVAVTVNRHSCHAIASRGWVTFDCLKRAADGWDARYVVWGVPHVFTKWKQLLVSTVSRWCCSALHLIPKIGAQTSKLCWCRNPGQMFGMRHVSGEDDEVE